MVKRIFSGLVVALGFAATAAIAQPVRDTYQDWLVECVDDSRESCVALQAMSQTIELEDGEEITQEMLRLVLRMSDDGQPILQIRVPLGVDVRPGLVTQVDDGEEQNASYTVCTDAGCNVLMIPTEEQLSAWRNGSVIRVGYRAFGTTDAVVLEGSLLGFTAASEAVLN